MGLLDSLNPEQREAAGHQTGPLLILAGAGSGKTRVIVHRIAYLLQCGVRPESILAVSFTNRAVREMEERVASMLSDPKQVRKLTLSTFHSLGVKILRRDLQRIGYPIKFAIYDAGDQLAMIRRAMRLSRINEKDVEPKNILIAISNAKNRFESPEDVTEPMLRTVYGHYQRALKSCGAVDFDDLIRLPVSLMREFPEVRDHWAGRFEQIMVDEYQDTNRAQFLMAKELASIHGNLCVVGDDDQSIYGWRGSDVENIRQFSKQFEDTRVVMLTQNYRCSANILEAANQVIAKSKGRYAKELWTQSPPGTKISLAVLENEVEESRFVVDHLYRLKFAQEMQWSDIAIMYRTNAQSRAFEEQLRNDRVPYRMVGGQNFFERKEIKDLTAYLKLLHTDTDEIAVRRIINYPARGIGGTTIDRIADFARAHEITFYASCARVEENQNVAKAQRSSVLAFIDMIERHKGLHRDGKSIAGLLTSLLEEMRLKNSLYKEYPELTEAKKRIDNVDALLNGVVQYESHHHAPSLEDYLELVSLDQRFEDKGDDEDEDAVTLITLHGAKGLEFPVVYLVGWEEGFLPYYRPTEACDVEEERRLAYVGITRAKKRLIISRAEQRMRFGKKLEREPSRFLHDIPRSLLEYITSETPVAPEVTEEQREKNFKDFFAKIRDMTE